MTDQQIQLLRWMLRVFETLGDNKLRKCVDGIQMAVICSFAVTQLRIALGIKETARMPTEGDERDIAELNRMLGL